MIGIRTTAAAEMLGVSPGILRSWEERFGFPEPRRSAGGQRRYDLAQVESLRHALLETHSVPSAVELARRRGNGASSLARLLNAFREFDDKAADRVMEESLTVRSVERVVDDVMLPAIQRLSDRDTGAADPLLARRWASGWLFAALRAVPHPPRHPAVLLFDSGDNANVDSLRVQAVELGLRRVGISTVVLPFERVRTRVLHAVRAVDPAAFVACGREATPAAVERLLDAIGQAGFAAPLFTYAAPGLAGRGTRAPSLGSSTTRAVEYLKAYVEDRPVQLTAMDGAGPLVLVPDDTPAHTPALARTFGQRR